MFIISGFELYSRWVPLIIAIILLIIIHLKKKQPFCFPFGRLNIRFKRGRRPVTDTVDRHIKTRTHKSVFYKGRRLDFFGILRISPVSISLVKTFYMVLLCCTRFAVLIVITLEILKTSMLFPCLEPIAIEIASTTAGL